MHCDVGLRTFSAYQCHQQRVKKSEDDDDALRLKAECLPALPSDGWQALSFYETPREHPACISYGRHLEPGSAT